VTDKLVNEWGPKVRPRLRSWVDRAICRRRGHRMVPLRATWTERRDDGPWTHQEKDAAGSACERCGLGEVSIEFAPDLGLLAVHDIRASR
jgi:hypothetical protein